MFVNHKNGCKHDNRVANIEWVSASENQKHAYRTGLASNKGESHSQSKLKDGEAWLIKKILSTKTVPQAYVARMFRVHPATISGINLGRLWSHITYP